MSFTSQTALRKDLRTTPVRMQHRHYATIAGIIRDLPELKIPHDLSGAKARTAKKEIAVHFMIALTATNPNFNQERFLRACGVED